jgi:uncharacterized protein YndB with AHSA1/START domain
MNERIDQASRIIRAEPVNVYQAFVNPEAMVAWLPPEGMTGRILAFDFREGGMYRMVLTYEEEDRPAGKTSDNTDEIEIRIIKLIENRLIEQTVTFESEDADFSGEMKITWSFIPDPGGTRVTVRCENVPPGIKSEDHQAGLSSSLQNLAEFTERQ